MPRLNLAVPWYERQMAREMGAKWDYQAKKWFMPEGLDTSKFALWIPYDGPDRQPDDVDRAPEKIMRKQLLTMDRIPMTTWFSNVRSAVSKSVWQKLKDIRFEEEGRRCMICGGRGMQHPVQLHEEWEFDDVKRIQILRSLIVLCPACHEGKHPGLANVHGRGEIAFQYIRWVNQWNERQMHNEWNDAVRVNLRRSQHEWLFDMDLLDRYMGEGFVETQVLGSNGACRPEDKPVDPERDQEMAELIKEAKRLEIEMFGGSVEPAAAVRVEARETMSATADAPMISSDSPVERAALLATTVDGAGRIGLRVEDAAPQLTERPVVPKPTKAPDAPPCGARQRLAQTVMYRRKQH